MTSTRTERDLDDRIVVDPDVMVGKPVIRGTRIPVELVLRFLSNSLELDELYAAYPRLTAEDVRACIRYANRAVEGRSRRRSRSTASINARPARG
jgi:uncharacterized protein (DUF433 family)